jgi:hypothetical protein
VSFIKLLTSRTLGKLNNIISHFKSPEGSIVRFGSLLGGSVDGADELQEVGLDECIYKVSPKSIDYTFVISYTEDVFIDES